MKANHLPKKKRNGGEIPRAKKRFGQNFLIDETILDRIVDACDVTKDDVVLEIGPGRGALTRRLSAAAKKVVAVEIDEDLRETLSAALLETDNVVVRYEDILDTDLQRLREEENEGRPFKVVANLPYYISTPVIMKLLRDATPPSSCTVMVQKELAERMGAAPGGKEYGALSIAVQYYATPIKVCDASPEAFRPRPQVDSSVIKLTPLSAPAATPKDPDFFFRVVEASFAHRRKTLVNSLSADASLRLSKSAITDALRALPNGLGGRGVDENARAERLSIAQFAALSDLLRKTDVSDDFFSRVDRTEQMR